MLSRAQNTFHHNPRLRGPVSSVLVNMLAVLLVLWCIKTKCDSTREILTLLHVNNTGADQTAHPRSLVSAFAVHYLEGIVVKLSIGNISIF